MKSAGLPEAAIQLVPTPDRAAVGHMLAGLDGAIDVIVPRGGKSLVERVQKEARVPVFAHLEGLCHTYVDRDADLDMAVDIVLNAKMRRTGVCGATETLLVDAAAPADFLPALVKALLEAGCEVRGDAATQQADARVKPATEADWATEYLDAIIAVKTVDGVAGAIEHIARYGTQHTDAIVTANAATAERFMREVDSRHRAAQRLDAVRRRRRVRLRRRDRHRHRQAACARTRRRRAAHELQIRRARRRADPAEVRRSCERRTSMLRSLTCIALALAVRRRRLPSPPKAAAASTVRAYQAPVKDCTRFNGRWGYYGNPWCTPAEQQALWDRAEARRSDALDALRA